MKRKKSICKSLFTICLILGLAFVLPNIKPVPVIAASKASYEIINKKEIRKYKNMSAKYLYQLPQLKGNSAAIKKINKSLRADYKKTLSGKESLFEYFEGDKYNSFRQDYGEKYYDTVTCKVMFNQNGYISFRYSCKWYAGGVGNVLGIWIDLSPQRWEKDGNSGCACRKQRFRKTKNCQYVCE